MFLRKYGKNAMLEFFDTKASLDFFVVSRVKGKQGHAWCLAEATILRNGITGD
jgi:hypothetical protein